MVDTSGWKEAFWALEMGEMFLFLKIRAAERKLGSADPFGERFSVEQHRLGEGKGSATVTGQ